MSPRPRRLALAVLAGLGAACGDPEVPSPPPAAPRVQRVEPSGEGASLSPAVTVRFSAPVSADGLEGGARLVLVPAAAEREALAAVESDAGASGYAGAVRGAVTLEDGGRVAVLRLAAPLHALVPYAVVVGSRLRGADGRAVLDADGKKKATVAHFTTGPAPGPAARPVIAQLRTDAETPEAGGEYVLLANAGEGALDLFGAKLEKRSSGGGVSACVLGEGEVPPGGLALVVGGAYDERYAVPPGTVITRCGTTSLLGGLANDRFPSLRLLDPLGAALSTAGAGGGPVCAIAVRLDLDGPDEPGNWACADSD